MSLSVANPWEGKGPSIGMSERDQRSGVSKRDQHEVAFVSLIRNVLIE